MEAFTKLLKSKSKKTIEPFVKYIRSQKIGDEIKFLISDSNGENEKMVSVKLAELK